MKLMVFVIMVCCICMALNELIAFGKWALSKFSQGAAKAADLTSEKPTGKKK